MNSHRLRAVLLAAIAGQVIGASAVRAGQVLTSLDAQFDTYFGAQSDSFQASDPTNLPSWPAVGPGPYSGTALPSVPGPPGGMANVPYPYPSGSNSPFLNDPDFNNFGSMNFFGGAGAIDPPSVDSSFYINMHLIAAAGGYAYEQFDFALDFQVAPGDVLPQSVTSQNINILVGAYFPDSDGFAQFGGQVTYWDGSTGEQLAPAITYTDVDFNPGNLDQFFAEGVTLNAVPGGDIFRITGDFFLIGEDAQVGVQTPVSPEPSTMWLVASALVFLALARIHRGKWRLAASR